MFVGHQGKSLSEDTISDILMVLKYGVSFCEATLLCIHLLLSHVVKKLQFMGLLLPKALGKPDYHLCRGSDTIFLLHHVQNDLVCVKKDLYSCSRSYEQISQSETCMPKNLFLPDKLSLVDVRLVLGARVPSSFCV